MPIMLRGEFITHDPRLDRLVQFDERSRSFPIRETLGPYPPRGYTWSVNKHLDQGYDGACVGFSMAHEVIARPWVDKRPDARFAKESIYWEAQKIDPWNGGSYPGAYPFYEGTSVLAGIKVIQRLGYVSEYRWAFGLEDLILAVGYKGPAILGIDWTQDMLYTDSNGYIKPTGSLVGGHAILCYSVSAKYKFFRLWNSWGADWGENGTAKVSFADMETLLYRQGEAVIPVKRHNLK